LGCSLDAALLLEADRAGAENQRTRDQLALWNEALLFQPLRRGADRGALLDDKVGLGLHCAGGIELVGGVKEDADDDEDAENEQGEQRVDDTEQAAAPPFLAGSFLAALVSHRSDLQKRALIA